MMGNDVVIHAENVSKKFCRNLKRSLWYGVRDIASELAGRSPDRGSLREGEFFAVRDLSLTLHAGQTLGLIGPNGAGKTTLLRMLNGLIKPDQGRITVRGQLQALIALGAGFSPILTGRENVYVNASVLGISKKEVDRQFDAIVEFAGIPDFIDSPVQTYSSGMNVRLGFAVAAHLKPDILLVDEVLAVGDEGFQVKCLNKIGELRKNGTAIILVSHNMHSIQTFSDGVLLKTQQGHCLYDDVAEGVSAYKALFLQQDASGIEKICSGTPEVKFNSAGLDKTTVAPGEDLTVRLEYNSNLDIDDIEIDVALRTLNESAVHFQATNHTFRVPVAVKRGMGTVEITIEDLKPMNTTAKLAVAIWTPRREQLLFWWRFPVTFQSTHRSSGSNFYNVRFAAS